MIADILPTATQTIASSSEFANPYIAEAMGLIKIPLALIMVVGIIALLVNTFHSAMERLTFSRPKPLRDRFDDEHTKF